ncbi:MAG: hypothetical protein ACRD0R_14495 [Acidimicrobiales bacterium]
MIFDEVGLKGSISAYYHTRMGGVFVGVLCALAVFSCRTTTGRCRDSGSTTS